jgi:hypothetical protein
MARIAFRDPRFAPSLGARKPVGAPPSLPASGDGRERVQRRARSSKRLIINGLRLPAQALNEDANDKAS